MKPVNDPVMLAALHEAAHAVICEALGGYVVGMTALREQAGSGTIRFALPESTPGQKPHGATAAVHLAGKLAEEFSGHEDSKAAKADWHKATACGFNSGTLLEIETQVRRLLRERWSTVVAVAKQLAARGRIGGPETMKLIEQHSNTY